ncbi:hypothetical protein AK812_SmicGene32990 [Symbiodinium microadriaticum]|uniref:Uncharacterized protein n=1 Tax=Symbiodinium microadriaticum TaxID=2951 RepID=A0A1Q9CSS2_SYMMI|nr:hypothetical protein AK812_SmicGene32990 [Symbiodinium microadriaticum]
MAVVSFCAGDGDADVQPLKLGKPMQDETGQPEQFTKASDSDDSESSGNHRPWTLDLEVMYGAGDQGTVTPAVRRNVVQALNFSPPEELPAPLRRESLSSYLEEISVASRSSYLEEISAVSRSSYLEEISVVSSRYLEEISVVRSSYLEEISVVSRSSYLEEISVVVSSYLAVISVVSHSSYLAVISVVSHSSYLAVISMVLRSNSYLAVISMVLRSNSYLEDQGRGNSKSDDEAYDSRPGSPPQPTPMELLGVIATGMRQLQEVQLGQMEKKDTPEVVKPGISSLPMLESPGKETSPVDIQDWLEEVGSIMGDLSDTSNEWWKAVREMADTHYKRWVTATPMEKLALALPKDAKLEYGKYGRVNSRAAGMILGALPAEVKSEMVTKKCTGSSTSLVFKLLTTYRPGGEQEKTQLLEQLTTPEGATSPDLAVQALRRWGRWFSRAQDLAVTVPDPVLMVKGLASIVNPVLSKNQDVWLRTTMMRNRLQLDSNPTEATTLDYHRHLQAEMELLSTASSTTGRAPPRLKSATAATEPPSATPASTSQSSRRRTSRAGGLRKATKAARREWSALFNTTETPLEWDTRRRTAPPRSQPTKKSADGPQATSSPNSAKGKGKGDKGAQASTATSGATPATRAVSTATPTKDQPQPGPEPSPTSSPASAAKEPPGDIQQILTDAHQMLRTMLATTAPSATSTTTGAPTYESIQRQLDEMRLKAMKVKEVVVAEDTFRGALLDSGATHVLRPAKDENEHLQSKEVPVVLAGDERRLLRQTPGGSIILNPTTGEEAQTILVLGRLVSYLGCSLKWTRGGLQLKHPKYGTIHTRIRAGCPEITNTVQAAALIAELESRKVEELREKTAELQDRLNAIRMMEVTKGDWRHDLAAYAQEGCVVDGLQTLYKSPMFKDLPEDVLMGMVPNVDVNDKAGWEYLKALPVNRRVSRAWVVNLYGGRKLKEDPVQMLNNKISPDTNTEVVVVNAEILLDGGWDVKGPAYKALMWGAMTSRIKGVIGSPPAKTYAGQRPLRTLEEPYGITGLNPTEAYRTNKETALAARQFLLYLVAHACSKDKFVAWMMKNPDVEVGASAPKDGISLWQTPMAKEFMEITAPLGTTTTQWTLSEDGEKVSKVTVHDNLNLKALVGDDESGLAVASTLNWKANTELQKLSVEQELASLKYDFTDLEDDEAPAEHSEVMFPDEREGFSPEVKAMKAADKLWDDDELAGEQQVKDAAEEESVEGNYEIPVDYLYFARPLKSKSSKHVMMAIQEIVLQLK